MPSGCPYQKLTARRKTRNKYDRPSICINSTNSCLSQIPFIFPIILIQWHHKLLIKIYIVIWLRIIIIITPKTTHSPNYSLIPSPFLIKRLCPLSHLPHAISIIPCTRITIIIVTVALSGYDMVAVADKQEKTWTPQFRVKLNGINALRWGFSRDTHSDMHVELASWL